MATKKQLQTAIKTSKASTKKTTASKHLSRTVAASNKPKSVVKRTRKTKRIAAPDKRVFLIALALVLFMIGATYAYAMYAASQPANVLKQALAKTLQAETASVTFTMTDTDLKSDQESVLQLAGPVTSQGQFDLTGGYSKADKRLAVDLRSFDGTDAYLRLDGLAGLPALLGDDAALYGITEQDNSFSGLDDDWLVVPANIKDTVIQNKPVDGKTDYDLSDEDEQRIAVLYDQNEFLKVTDTYAEDFIDGKDSYHYQVSIDQAVLEAYLKSVQRDIKSLKLIDAQIASLVASASGIQVFEVWISKNDNRFSKIYFDTSVGTDKKTIELILGNFDLQASIDKPVGATPLLEALTELREK